ncbi:nitroreductase family protein [Aerococcus sp. UMB7834]|uniref:nitroreductase family protein n=1 Tax=Aerococcus sp. UMB7834 TaxID=3046342 RepID=UPI002550DF99|nr:nitroreductase family protein [Aerococcus sp. UMB7834]MDK6804640.1 nitroreductase family protein [Aerococcus sp. UMB7834]
MCAANEWLDKQLDHRTIREFKDQAVPEEIVDQLAEVAMRTATSEGMQMASIIRVKDPDKRHAIAEVGKQEYIARAPELWIFLVDTYRNQQIAEQEGRENLAAHQLERFLQGYSDAVLMAQNVNNAVESLGMGAVFLGSIQNNMGQMIDILDLPPLTAPVLGLAFGEPNQSPQLKPRMPKTLRFFEDTYHLPEDAESLLEDYDQEMTTYYDLRDANRRVDSFFKQVGDKMENRRPRREALIDDLRKQGFNLTRDREE